MSPRNSTAIRVTVWNENVHETAGDERVLANYPSGIHTVIARALSKLLGDAAHIRTATLQEKEHGLTQDVIDSTDVLVWWGHIAHDQVSDEVVERVLRAVHAGMGILVLHSGHYSKIFKRLMGSTCSLLWRNDGDRELVWSVAPAHPITQGISNPIQIPLQEMYGEFFDIPAPDELIFISSFSGGEVFRSGVTYQRGLGKVFYFSPGDQDFPVYHQPDIQQVLANGVRWAAPAIDRRELTADYHATDWFVG
jgi:trehalose utilization protein